MDNVYGIITNKETVRILNDGKFKDIILKYNSNNLPPVKSILNRGIIKRKCKNKSYKVEVKDETTIQSIERLRYYYPNSIISFVNFANENFRGGFSGLGWDDREKKVIYLGDRAKAQEENLIEKSTLFLSLVKIRYPFDSEKRCFLGPVQIFATDYTSKSSKLISNPINAFMITSASISLRSHTQFNRVKRELILSRIRDRIRCQLLAGQKLKEDNPKKKNIIVLGAYGCGAFAPEHWEDYDSHYKYALAVANIYKEEIEENFCDVFDQITFATPKFKSLENSKSYLNYLAFFNTFG